MATYEAIVREVCQELRALERNAIANGEYELYWHLFGERMYLVRTVFPHLFFSSRVS